jgi:hypothetical protein
MNVTFIMLTLFLMLLLYSCIHLIINRGKFEFKYMTIAVAYSLLVGLPVFYFNLFPEKLNLVFYIVYYAIVLMPVYINEFFSSLKKRQLWMRFILIFTGVNIILVNPFLTGKPKFWSLIIGLLLIFWFFLYLFRYPHLNPMWLDDAAKKAAADVVKERRYSSKPIIVPITSRSPSCSKSSSLFLLFKKKHAIVSIKKDFHSKLGSPDMEQFAEELVKRIKEKINGK